MVALEARIIAATHLELEQPIDLPPGRRVLVFVEPSPDTEREDWHALSKETLRDAYGASEPEYSLDLLKVPGSPAVSVP